MRGPHRTIFLLALFALGGAACGEARNDLGSDTLARAGAFELGVEQTANLIAPVADLPQDPSVVEALADFWIDYSLLALVINREGALEELDLGSVTRQQRNQELVMVLRDEVIDVDPEVTDEELREIFEQERPGERVRARHILLRIPDGADEADAAAVRELAEDLRRRAAAGEDFAALAREHSEDPGSAERGGDLNFFGRGTMVAPFEEAAFALEPGEVSDVVETQFGFHVIRVEERDSPTLDDVRAQLRQEIQQERTARAESLFVAGVEEPAEVGIATGAFDRTRELAGAAELSLSGREAGRELVTYQGGAYTAGDLRDFLRNQPAQLRQQIAGASDDQLESMLRNLTRGELLVREAEHRGIELPEGYEEELEEEIRDQLRQVAGLLGLDGVTPQEGETLEEAVEREISELLPRLVRGEQDVFPLGNLAVPLRERYDARVSRENIERTVERIAALRGQGPDGEAEELDLDDLEGLLEQLELEETEESDGG
jgi:peptidyl-prolyl cis-trans isomerase C